MAGRPPLPIGTHGKISFRPLPSGSVQAATQFRDADGVTRKVTASGRSKSAASSRLEVACLNRRARGSVDLTPDSLVSSLVEQWWAEWMSGDVTPGSVKLYRDRLDKQVLPALGALRVRELTVSRVDHLLQEVARRNGPSLAKTTRSVLSGLCGFAARHDALDRNPVSDAARITKPKKSHLPTAFTLEQARDIRLKYRSDARACDLDVPDLLDFMLGTGLRLAEACAIEWDSVDLEAGTVRVGEGVLEDVSGSPAAIRRGSSLKLTPRTLELPPFAQEMLKARYESAVNRTGVVFTAPLGGLRDLSNTSRAIKQTFTRAGYPWATSHTMRRTVATLMDSAGLSARAAADQLGHSKPSMTQDVYYARQHGPTGARDVLEAIAAP